MTLSRRQLLASSLAAPVASSLALAGCTRTQASQTSGFAEGDGSFTAIAPGKRAKAPVISGKDLGQQSLSTATYAGRVVVLNVWGSWCAPCRKEAPDLVKAAKELGDRVQFLGINTRDLSPEPAQAFVRAFAVPYPSFFDPDGALLLDLNALPPNAIPSTLVLDTQGRIAARVTGAVTATTIVGAVNDVLAGK